MAAKDADTAHADDLVRKQIITEEDLERARKREASSGLPWYRQLVQMGKLDFGSVNDILQYEFHSPAERKSHTQLGAALVNSGRLTKDQLKSALSLQKKSGKLLGVVLVEEGFVTREDIGRALAEQYGLEFVPASDAKSERRALEAVSEHMAKQKEFIPIKLEGDKLTVLISGIQVPDRLKTVGTLLGYRMHPMMTAVEDLDTEIEVRYHGRFAKAKARSASKKSKTRKLSDTVEPVQPASEPTVEQRPPAPPEPDVAEEESEMEVETVQEKKRFDEIAREASGASVVQLVTTIIEGAVNSGATDIHLDPQEPEMRVRYRIDGVLHDVMSIPETIENAVISRIKILADIDITETRQPQDGHISLDVGEAEFDVRVATLPTYLGERVVLRLLDQSSVLAGIKDLGLETEDEKRLRKIIEQPYGMVLVTGPTGSGKTTTLYSCLNEMNVMEDSIVTLEDPVEYQLSGINQVQIDPDIDMTFAKVLRAALRQDIDVLLVGEIRDPETARIAIRAAMTGHLVFSTLHTNDAPEAISTLRNMDIPSYLIASALTAVVAQRLVRRICDNCKSSFTPNKTLLKSVRLPETTKRLHRGKGCENCYQTGSRGRTGIFEVLEVNEPIRKLIVADEPVDKIAKAAKLKTMAERARQKVKSGVIAPEELLRVIRT